MKRETAGGGSALHVGAVFLDRYELLSVLGSGGFGLVFKGRQLSTGQEVAVKVIRVPVGRGSSREQDQRNARFVREMKLCARLKHPHIVKLVDSGQTPQGELFTVFEFVPGRDLGQVIQEQGPLEVDEAVRLMAQVADGLAAAHNQGVVHRDLKPGNIMITSTGAQRNATILDFGIGAFVNQVVEQEQGRITTSGEMLGTPLYAPPEQLCGSAPNTRSDLYSWGLVLLECLTGKPAVSGASVPEIVSRQIGSTPVSLPSALRHHPLGELLGKVLVKDVSKREATAEGVLRSLLDIDASVLRQLRDRLTRAEPRTTQRAVYTPDAGDELVRPSGERRQLTVVGCLLSVMGLGSQSVDLEEFDEGVHWLRVQCEAAARRFGGYITHWMSDRILIYFGYPTAHENDARRAASAAVWLAAQARDRTYTTGQDSTRIVQVGIDTGVVIARPGRGGSGSIEVIGPATVIASHLSQIAEPNSVLVSGATRELLDDDTETEPVGSCEVQGVGNAVAAYRLSLAPRSRRVAATSLSAAERTVLTGREHEMALLMDRWERSCQGSGQAILISGEPGIGKSRLARELVSSITEGQATVLDVYCAEYGEQSPLLPVVEMLERSIGLGRDQTDEQQSRMLSQYVNTHDLSASQAAVVLGALLHVPIAGAPEFEATLPDKRRQLTFDALLSMVVDLSERQPVLLMVDDLQWADPSTLEWVTQLVDQAPSSRLCVLMTARPEFSPPWPPTKVWSLQPGRLTKAQVEQMLRSLSCGRDVPATVVDEIFHRTDGVCLFVEELARMLLSSDGLDSTAQSSRRPIPSGDTPIPATLRDLLTSRLDALGGAKRTAQLASAMGTDFTYELLEAASPLSDSQLREDLQALVDADLVRLQRRRTQTSYCFKHVLVRDAAYDSMLNETRRQAHATIARAIEQDLPGLARERTDLLALHHAAADNVERALDCAMNASMAALQRSANAEALQMGTLALDWLKAVPNTKRRQEAELGLGAIVTPALMALRGFGDPTVKARAERTLKLAGQVGSSPATAPALGALGTYYMVLADRARCREVSERLLTLAEETNDDGLKVAALPSLGASMLDEGKFAEARRLLERAITLHDVEAHAHHAFQFGLDSLAYARMLRGLTMCHLGFPDQGLRDANAALERAESVNHVSSTVLAILYHALIGALLDEPALTAKFAQRTISVAAENALKFHLGYGSILHAWATGDLPALAQGVGMLEVLGAGLALPFYRSLLAQAEAKSLNLQGALEIAQRSLAWIRETGNLSYLAGTLAAKGSYLWQLNATNPEPAEEALREAISVAQAQGTKFQELRATLELSRVLGGTKRSVEARALLEPLVGWFAEGFDLPDLRRARALLKELGSSEPRVRSSRTRKRRTAPKKGEKS